MRVFAVVAPGLEPFLIRELQDLGFSIPTLPAGSDLPGDQSGGVEFEAGLEGIYRVNLMLRTASRILVRLGEFYTTAFWDLVKKASKLEWERFLNAGQAVQFRVACHRSRLYHSGAVAERVADAIGARLGMPMSVTGTGAQVSGEPPQLIVVRLASDRCTISIDSSGEHLHRRGYRLGVAKAPLRETLAAGMLFASGWDNLSPLTDPFCGSGTIPIEAALLACKIPPGGKRAFAFQSWPGYQAELFDHLLQEAWANVVLQTGSIAGFDRDAGAIRLAQENATRAGVAGAIQFSVQAFSHLSLDSPGWVVSNLPYGLRLKGGDLRNLYAQVGNVLRRRFAGWRFALLSNQHTLLDHTWLEIERRLPFINGGMPVFLGIGEV